MMAGSYSKMNTQSNWPNAAAPRSDTCDASHNVLSCGQAAGISSSEVLNLEELRHRCMGNVQLVQRLLEKFQQRLPENWRLETLWNSRILSKTHASAPRQRTSASVSAKGLAQAAAEIESVSRAGKDEIFPAASNTCATSGKNIWTTR